MIDRIRDCLSRAVSSGVFPGCAAGVVYKGRTEVVTAGRLTYDPESPAVMKDTVYDAASLTKAVPVSCLALKLIESGRLSRSEHLVRYVPEVCGPYRDLITVDHLLTHTIDFNFRLSDVKNEGPDGIMRAIFNVPMRFKPGEKFCYANATSILLGLLLECCTGKKLDILADETFFKPLGMNSTFFRNDSFSREKIAPTEIDPWRGGEVRGEVHDESAWVMRPGVVGSAGLFSTAPDMLKFIYMLLEGGEMGGKRFFRPETIQMMHTNQLSPGTGAHTGLGWELDQESFMGKNRSGSAFGKTGFTGCTIVIDPEKMAGFVLMCNHIYPRRRENRDQINRIRSGLADIVFSVSG